ncbi:hypothetical protein G6F56_009115 [Rhizopus delemar]|nr:hypothetical protein G6F56_009115 [Rhizopus delemar]
MTHLADSCFVDIDLTEATTLEMERKPIITIWKAAQIGDVEALDYYLRTDPTLVDRRDPLTECTLLHLLLSNVAQPIRALELLLQYGADPNIPNVYNIQAIHIAFLHLTDPLGAVSLLLSYHADPNARDGDGWSPLHYASRFCPDPKPLLKLLIGAGASLHATDVSRKSALFSLLAGGDHSETLDWLIHQGANCLLKGDFLDSQTRTTHEGTLVLQAAKYARLNSLRILIGVERWQVVLSRHELEEAIDLVRQQLLNQSEREQIEKLGLMIMILEDLIQKLNKRNTCEDGKRRSSCCKFCPKETDPFNPFEETSGMDTPPLNTVYMDQEQPFSQIYILNLFMAPDMKRYLQETPPSDDVYQMPVHITKLVLEARMSDDKEAYERLEKVRDYAQGMSGTEDPSAMIQAVNRLMHDDDELTNIINK